jgi:hypothetical protein
VAYKDGVCPKYKLLLMTFFSNKGHYGWDLHSTKTIKVIKYFSIFTSWGRPPVLFPVLFLAQTDLWWVLTITFHELAWFCKIDSAVHRYWVATEQIYLCLEVSKKMYNY